MSFSREFVINGQVQEVTFTRVNLGSHKTSVIVAARDFAGFMDIDMNKGRFVFVSDVPECALRLEKSLSSAIMDHDA